MIKRGRIRMFFMYIFGIALVGCLPIKSGVPYDGSPYRDPGTMTRGEIMHVPTGFNISKDQFFDMMSVNRILYVGESHNNVYDHQMELEIIKNLHARFPGKIAVGMEMLSRQNQKEVDQWLDGEMTEKEFIGVFALNWGVYDYSYYRDLFHFIREKKIPLLALNADRDEKEAVIKNSYDGQGGDESSPADYDDPYRNQALSAMFSVHKKGHDDQKIFVAIQELWEKIMADSIISYLTSDFGREKKMIIITGGFHVAHGFGIPRRVFRRLKLPYTVVLSHTPEDLVENERQLIDYDSPGLPLYRAEYLWCLPYRNFKDQQVKLGVILTEKEDSVSIVSVIDEGAAYRAGLIANDRIVSFDGQGINSTFDLQYLLIRKKPGDHAVIDIIRDNHQMQFPVVFVEGPENK